MSTRVKLALVILVVAVPAFLLAPVLFPHVDSVLLGAGVAFVLFGWPLVRRVTPDSHARAMVLFLAVAWVTVSWYPHIGLHGSAFGSTFGGLLVIDYLFHVPLYVISVGLIWALIGYLRSQGGTVAPEAPAGTDVPTGTAPATGS